MVLQGAEILFYPTAIGSEPQDQELDSRDHWKRVMQGHAGANLVRSNSFRLFWSADSAHFSSPFIHVPFFGTDFSVFVSLTPITLLDQRYVSISLNY